MDAGKTEISAPVSARYVRPALSRIMNVFPLSLPLIVLTDSGLYGRCGVVDDVGEEMDEDERVVMPAGSTDRRARFPPPSELEGVLRKNTPACM